MAEALAIGSSPLSIEDAGRVCREARPVHLTSAALDRMRRGREALERRLDDAEKIYGVNTGVGGNIRFTLSTDQAELLQHNIMRHLSCATGRPLPADVVRGSILLRLATFATGCSAVRPELAEALARMLNAGITPVVPRYGSLGASGDLMPSAYAARVLLGMGEAEYQGRRVPASEALRSAGLEAIAFAPKKDWP